MAKFILKTIYWSSCSLDVYPCLVNPLKMVCGVLYVSKPYLNLSSMLSPAIPSPPPVLGEVTGRVLEAGAFFPLPGLYFASKRRMVSRTRDFGRGGGCGFRGLFSFGSCPPRVGFLNYISTF